MIHGGLQKAGQDSAPAPLRVLSVTADGVNGQVDVLFNRKLSGFNGGSQSDTEFTVSGNGSIATSWNGNATVTYFIDNGYIPQPGFDSWNFADSGNGTAIPYWVKNGDVIAAPLSGGI